MVGLACDFSVREAEAGKMVGLGVREVMHPGMLCKLDNLSSIPETNIEKPDVVANNCNLSLWETSTCQWPQI